MTRLPQHRVFSRHFLSISIVLLGLAFAPLLFVSTSHAQVNGTPASVTSPGFGGNAVNGPRASVTSVGPTRLHRALARNVLHFFAEHAPYRRPSSRR